MRIVFLTESLGKGHAPPFGEAYSVGGSSSVFFNGNSFGVKKAYLQAVIQKKPDLVVLGTDADLVGTKVATIWKRELEERGIKTIRMPLTSKGYAFVGKTYGDEALKALKEVSYLNLTSFQYSKGVLGKGISMQKAITLKALNGAPRKFKTKRGTNTATFVVRALKDGISPTKAMGILQRAYSTGAIFYPRVDADYNSNGLDVYAHPPLSTGELKSPYLKPFEEEEISLTRETALLYLNQRGLLPPSSLEPFFRTTKIDENGRVPLSSKEEKVIEEITKEDEENFLSNFYLLFPKMPLKKVNLKKVKEKELIDYLLSVQEELEKETEVETERKRESRKSEKRVESLKRSFEVEGKKSKKRETLFPSRETLP